MDVPDPIDVDIDLVLLTRAFFVLGALAAIILHGVPSLRAGIIDYGARSSPNSQEKGKGKDKREQSLLRRVNFSVPHAWFTAYYAFSILCGLSWMTWLNSPTAKSVLQSPFFGRDSRDSMAIEQVWLCMILLLLHSCRRLYECLAYTKKSSATMPVSIFGVGIAFYFFVNIAVWVEGAETLRTGAATASLGRMFAYVLARPRQNTVYLALFLLSSIAQNRVHRYLSTLKKYTLPSHFLFTSLNVVSPHYTFEILLYVSLALIAAPEGETFNKTMLCVVFWTAVNLGLVADDTREWSITKFGQEVQQRWRIVPLIW